MSNLALRPETLASGDEVGAFYDELDCFFREIWGEHVHHGLWETGKETPEQAVSNLIDRVAELAHIKKGDAVCDVGTGYGGTARRLATRFGARVTGLTVSSLQYRYAMESNNGAENPRYLLRNWYRNDFPDASFDSVVALESLAHMGDRETALAEALRVLKPGGRLVLCLWLADETLHPWQRRYLIEPICREGRLGGLISAADYRRLLADTGFKLDVFDDVSRSVAQTWTICIRRVLTGIVGKPGYVRYLLDGSKRNRSFFWSLFRIRFAYAAGAMRYGIAAAHRP